MCCHGAAVEFTGVHHVGLLCENTERSLEFYCGLLGLEINPTRPNDKLPYGGKWLNVGSQMIHLMELPNPDPKTGRPKHGGRDRHACVAIKDVSKLKVVFDKAGVPYTLSKSGRPAIFARDPDGNALEFVQTEWWWEFKPLWHFSDPAMELDRINIICSLPNGRRLTACNQREWWPWFTYICCWIANQAKPSLLCES